MVQVLREALVDVDDHWILLLRVEVLRLNEDAGEFNAVEVLVVNQLRLAPDEVLLLRIGVSHFAELAEVRVGDEVIREIVERGNGQKEHVGVLGLDRQAIGAGARDEHLGGAAARFQAVEAFVPRRFVDGFEQ